MHSSTPIEEALAECLDAMDRSETELRACLERYPQFRDELVPLLKLAVEMSLAESQVGPLASAPNEPMTIRNLGELARARTSVRSLADQDLPSHGVSIISRSIHAFARRHPLITWLSLFLLFLSFAFFAWLPVLGSTLLIYAISPILGTLLLILGVALLPWFLIRTVLGSTTKWLRSIVLSPTLPPRRALWGRDSRALHQGTLYSFISGWKSVDAAVRLWYRILAWSALRVVAFLTIFVWALPAWR